MADDKQEKRYGLRSPRWFLTRQNLAYEIEAAELEIARIEAAVEPSDEKRKAFERSRAELERVVKAFHRTFPRELFIWESLFHIHQDLLLVVPVEELRAEWDVVQTRISAATKETDGEFPWKKRRLDNIEKELDDLLDNIGPMSSAPSDDTDSRREAESRIREIRSRIREIRKHLDDQDLIRIWRSLQARRFIRIFALLVSLFGALLIVFVCVPEIDCLTGQCTLESKHHSVFGVIAAGILGASLSALADLRRPVRVGVPLFDWQLGRPVVGGAAGLFLYLVSEAGIIVLDYPVLYLAAMGFAFSERALFRALRGMADRMESDIGRAWRN